jgi:hypothetical protein
MRVTSTLPLIVALLSSGPVTPVSGQTGADEEPQRLDAADRAWIASRIYRAVELNFGHWDDVPGYDLPGEYRRYLETAMSGGRRTVSGGRLVG